MSATAVEMGGRNTTNNTVTVTSQVGTGTLPQDYLSPSASKTMTTSITTIDDDDGSKNNNVVGTASPRGPEGPFSPVNVSADGSTPRHDTSSSKEEEGSPTSSSTSLVLRDDDLSNIVDDANKEEYTTSSPSSTIKAEKVDLDLSIIGERVEIHNDVANDDDYDVAAAANVTDEESDAVFDASNKDFIRIIHGDRQVMLVMPSEVSIIYSLFYLVGYSLFHKNKLLNMLSKSNLSSHFYFVRCVCIAGHV